MPDLRAKIAAEIYEALKLLDAPIELLSVVGSYGDTLDDEEILALLIEWNRTGEVLHTAQ